MYGDLQIGECIAQFWRPGFDALLFPYLPPHITRRKELKKVFVVPLPEKAFFEVRPLLPTPFRFLGSFHLQLPIVSLGVFVVLLPEKAFFEVRPALLTPFRFLGSCQFPSVSLVDPSGSAGSVPSGILW